MSVFDDTACDLGEGPLWHPERQQLFWFDILGKKLLCRGTEKGPDRDFDAPVSAAGWIDEETLLIASASALMRLDLATGARQEVVAIEPGNPLIRSNDGRADPWGGFWIGTMGLKAEPGAGAIYRYHAGELRRLYGGLTVPNAISFAPGRGFACFADTPQQKVMRVALDDKGWPKGEPEVFLDLTGDGLFPDGAVFDAAGCLWLALWGGRGVQAFGPDGTPGRRVEVPADNTTCPAFGGETFDDLFVTSARQDLSEAALRTTRTQGMTFRLTGISKGLPEPRVRL